MTDLSDTITIVEDDEFEDDELVERDPWLRRSAIWVGGAAAVIGLVFAGGIAASKAAPDPIAATAGSPLVVAGTEDAALVASAPPTLPCVSWSYGEGATRKIVVSGSPCTTLTITDDGTPIASTVLAESPLAIGPVGDPIVQGVSASVPGQVYGDVLVMLERDVTSRAVSVVGRSLATFVPLWVHSCPTAGVVPSIHLSGGDIPDDPGANRSVVEVFGVSTYVAVGCDDTVSLYDPITGASI